MRDEKSPGVTLNNKKREDWQFMKARGLSADLTHSAGCAEIQSGSCRWAASPLIEARLVSMLAAISLRGGGSDVKCLMLGVELLSTRRISAFNFPSGFSIST